MLSRSRLLEICNYNPQTGIFSWIGKRTPWRGGYRGRYLAAKIDGRNYYLHRLAWLYCHGEWPIEIDHRNGDPLDNRLANLRVATRRQNSFNQGIKSSNTSGLKGVSWDRTRGLWIATIRVRGKKRNLGRFATKEEARAAYAYSAMEEHGEFARLL